MATLTANKDSTPITGGEYAFKVTGALDLQWQLSDEGFATVEDGVFTVSGSGIIDLPKCTIKIINMSTNEFIIDKVRK